MFYFLFLVNIYLFFFTFPCSLSSVFIYLKVFKWSDIYLLISHKISQLHNLRWIIAYDDGRGSIKPIIFGFKSWSMGRNFTSRRHCFGENKEQLIAHFWILIMFILSNFFADLQYSAHFYHLNDQFKRKNKKYSAAD